MSWSFLLKENLMLNSISRARILSGNALKLIAALLMLIDHIGVLFFPFDPVWRYIGRASMPIFAYMIAEGAVYTRSKVGYISKLAALALICQVVYYIANNDLYMSILVTFTLGLAVVFAWDFAKRTLFEDCALYKKIAAIAIFILAVAAVYILNELLRIDYGFSGCMLPWFASLFRAPKNAPDYVKRLDVHPVHVLTAAIGILVMTVSLGTPEEWAFAAIPLLLLYSGKRGKYKMKYFFYIFYPLHLAALYLIYMLI